MIWSVSPCFSYRVLLSLYVSVVWSDSPTFTRLGDPCGGFCTVSVSWAVGGLTSQGEGVPWHGQTVRRSDGQTVTGPWPCPAVAVPFWTWVHPLQIFTICTSLTYWLHIFTYWIHKRILYHSTQGLLKCLVHGQDCTLISHVCRTKIQQQGGAKWTDPLTFILSSRHCKT